MAAIVTTLVTSFGRLLTFLSLLLGYVGGFFTQLWTAAVAIIQPVLNVLSELIVFALRVVVDAFFLLLTLVVSILPSMPDTSGVSTDFSMLGQANRYIPISEVSAFAVIWASIFGAIALYKLAKFIRGAG